MTNSWCYYCLKEFEHLYILCKDCDCVKLCLFCFSCGVEAGQHKRTHRYTVRYKNAAESYACILNGWSDSEELDLLDAIEQYGLGNWEDIAAKSGRWTSQECFDHFNYFYLRGQLATVVARTTIAPNFITDHTSPAPAPQKPQVLSIDPIEQQLLGYMSVRDDFERDYDNDAESLLTRLKVRPECDELEDALHVAHVNIYTQRLQERQKRKEIARLHGLICRISAYLTYKRPKKRPSKNDVKTPLNTPCQNKSTPVLWVTKKKSSPASPPAGSWLAAPYSLQASGPTRGAPVVISGVIPFPREDGGNNIELEDYDAFNISEKLKPFLRYFTPRQAKQFLHNLRREEILKHEIKNLLSFLHKGSKKTLSSNKLVNSLKSTSVVPSQVYVAASPNTETIHPLLIGLPGFGTTPGSNDTAMTAAPKRSITSALRSNSAAAAASLKAVSKNRRKRRRRHHNTPWYARVQRYRR